MNFVTARQEKRRIPTYPIPAPDAHPMFFEKRVYQGSSGRVYPLAFYSRLSDTLADQPWDIWILENDYIKIELMPEIGGRIWRGLDKTNGYDFFYRQSVVKPALVGLAGPWISGGVEFNWPQHHRPATYLPTDATLQEHEDGARTLWMSDHDPMSHMKGMHGITVYPGSSRVELNARLYNRTPITQTFLWWANVAAEVHDQYQSFFPSDVQYVADHAVRAMSSFPIAKNRYYGVDYRPGTDLGWYKNIPVPTSYMVTKTDYNFFGGYDYDAEGGFVHVADQYISPGKKQWTWGNHAFGWAWDRELTDANERGEYPPYVELMAGVYTDNQPDFSYLLPYETKTFTQTWWPIRGIGVAHQANEDYAIHLSVEAGEARLGACASSVADDVRLRLLAGGQTIYDEPARLAPDTPAITSVKLPKGCSEFDLRLEVVRSSVVELTYQPPKLDPNAAIPASATEPLAPEQIESSDELYLVGEHLEQYRHPTRDPEPYWRNALERDPGDMRANASLGRRLLERALLVEAVEHLRIAVDRSRIRHPNPEDGEPLYFLGLGLKRLGRFDEAVEWLHKSAWNYTWRAPAHYQLGTIESARGRTKEAIVHLDAAIRANADHNHASVLKAALLRRLGKVDSAAGILAEIVAEDGLDHWAGYERVLIAETRNDGSLNKEREAWRELTSLRTPTLLDLALDYAEAGLYQESAAVLGEAVAPVPAMIGYTLAWVLEQAGYAEKSQDAHASAMQGDKRWCFPDRWAEEVVLRSAIKRDVTDGFACNCLGNLLYDKRRYLEAIDAWEVACRRDSQRADAQRNLGIAYFNVRGDDAAATEAYARAFELKSNDSQVLYEYDLLLKVTGMPLQDRLARLTDHRALVDQRDDLSIEYVTLLNSLGRFEQAAALLEQRRFHPWEGGEGKVLTQYAASRLGLGRAALATGQPGKALEHFKIAYNPPQNLGEARHMLANVADLHFYLGLAHREVGDGDAATKHFKDAAASVGDFLDMDVQPYSEKSYYQGRALVELGRADEATAVFQGMIDHGQSLCDTEAKIDFFATSLPNLLVFETDLGKQRRVEGLVLQGLGLAGNGQSAVSVSRFREAIELDPSNQPARFILMDNESQQTAI